MIKAWASSCHSKHPTSISTSKPWGFLVKEVLKVYVTFNNELTQKSHPSQQRQYAHDILCRIAHQRQQLTPTEAILNSVSQSAGPQSPSLLWGLLQNYHNTSPKPTSFIQTYNTPLQVSRQNATPLRDVQHSHVALRPKLAAHVSPLCW